MTKPNPNWADYQNSAARGRLTHGFTRTQEHDHATMLQCYTEPILHHHSAAFSLQPSPFALKA
jgi:hypothetical protein